jgi:hypothetical protein
MSPGQSLEFDAEAVLVELHGDACPRFEAASLRRRRAIGSIQKAVSTRGMSDERAATVRSRWDGAHVTGAPDRRRPRPR